MSEPLTAPSRPPEITTFIRAGRKFFVITEDEIRDHAPDFYPPSDPVIAWGYCKDSGELLPITVAGVVTRNYAVMAPYGLGGRFYLESRLNEEHPTIAAWLASVRRHLGIQAR